MDALGRLGIRPNGGLPPLLAEVFCLRWDNLTSRLVFRLPAKLFRPRLIKLPLVLAQHSFRRYVHCCSGQRLCDCH